MSEPHPQLDGLLVSIRSAPPGPVLVLGTIDAGKTTLTRSLATALAEEGPIYVADADPGQAWLGPPTTMGRARLSRRRRGSGRLKPDRLFFVGGTSPAANPELWARSFARLVTEEVQPDVRMIVDSPGLVTGTLADRVWTAVAQRTRFVRIVALQSEWELEPILLGFRETETVVIPCEPAPGVRPRDRDERTTFRRMAYVRYFRPGRLRYARRARVKVRGVTSAGKDLSRDRLVGLARDGRDLGLGVVRAHGSQRLGFVTPLVSLADVETVQVGGLWVDPETGRETYA